VRNHGAAHRETKFSQKKRKTTMEAKLRNVW